MAFCDSIKLEKGMYSVSGKGFTQILEEMDPSENYKGTTLEGLDAYQRQLKRFNIKVSGEGCDKVEKFFCTPDSAVLFPEFISRAIKQGIASCNMIPSITAANTVIDGIDYTALSLESSGSSPTAQGAGLPEVKVTKSKSLVDMKKYGRVLSSSYESLRFQNLDVVAVIFKQIGMNMAAEQLSDAVAVLSKDATTISAATSGTITYDDLLNLWASFGAYQPNVMIANNSTIKSLLTLPQMQDSVAGLGFHGTGKLVTPIGAQLIMDSTVEDGKILAFDKNFALQMIQAGDIVVEYDKVIDKQLGRATVSVTTGFSKICGDAVKLLG